jgi:ABC-type oligopeptide transport system substrate-binding subunit
MKNLAFISQTKIQLFYENVIKKSNIFFCSAFCVSQMLFLVVFLGCNSPATDRSKIICYTQDNALTSLDPAFARSQANNWLCRQLYNGLVDLDDSLRVVPALCKHYTIAADGLSYTFV